MPVPPPGYRIASARDGAVSAVRILAIDGTLAASGYAAEHADVCWRRTRAS